MVEQIVPTARVCIAIPTFRRTGMLAALLAAAQDLDVPPDVRVDVAVFDNDPLGSAAAVVSASRDGSRFPLSYRRVDDAGLSSVRNGILQETAGRYDFVAMIDDDEVPEPQWLRELLRVQRNSEACAVVGPVPGVYPPGAPRWIADGRFLEPPIFSDGDVLTDGWSGNCLLDLGRIRLNGLRFDPALNFAGGEDLVFFRQLIAAGGSIAYAADATANETVVAERASAWYIIKTNFRRGNTLAICDRMLAASRRSAIVRAVKGAGRILTGTLKFVPASLLHGRAGSVAAVSEIARGAGMIAGVCGFVFSAYKRSET
jgi:glycosyltransferase involved in cell wall biosynthesis